MKLKDQNGPEIYSEETLSLMELSPFTKFRKMLSMFSLQRKLMLFIVTTLSLIFIITGIFMYQMIRESLVESEHKHVEMISAPLAAKVGVWYFINKERSSEEMNDFFHLLIKDYDLGYIVFIDNHGKKIGEVRSETFKLNDPYVVVYEKPIYNPDNNQPSVLQGTLKIAYSHHVLKKLTVKFYTAAILMSIFFGLYLYMEMRLLKELLTPLSKIADEIKNYLPGDKLSFEHIYTSKNDVINEIATGFLHMQQNIDDAMRNKEIEEENNRTKDAILLKQSRFIEMGTMINNIAHQWKQPLNIIELCIADLSFKSMMGNLEQEYQQKLFEDMHMQVAFMSRTLDIFKNFLDNGHKELKKEKFSIRKSLDDTLQLLASTIQKNRVRIESDINDSISIYGAIQELEQTFIIIINNAMDAGSNIIKIGCSLEESDTVIRIQDNGGGFSEGIVDKIFDAYFTTKHQSQGTGLGLFIAKTIIELKFNGTIEAKNAEEGALFILRFPPSPEEEKS
ncbi:MAG: sensor histidine kinase [Sulfuricurvum sp.]